MLDDAFDHGLDGALKSDAHIRRTAVGQCLEEGLSKIRMPADLFDQVLPKVGTLLIWDAESEQRVNVVLVKRGERQWGAYGGKR